MRPKRLPPGLKRIMPYGGDKRTIEKFAQEYGLVYFGYVNQLDDEHRIVRGVTVSTKHRDEHYCIGSYEGYDIAFVERTDTLPATKLRKSSTHRWYIIEFDLHTSKDLPHFFVGLHSHSESFYRQLFTKYPRLRSIRLGNLGPHIHDFIMKYRVYASPEKTIEVEQLLKPEIGEMITKHFGALAIEVQGQSLFVYAEQPTVTPALLEAMIKNGTWMARHLDKAAEEVV